MVGGCRLHSLSRTTGQHALSSGESEIMSMSEVLKEAKLMQYNIEFCGWVFYRLSCTPTQMLPELFATREALEG